MANVEYKVLKNAILKSCVGEIRGTKFHINADKLSTSVDDMGLIFVKNDRLVSTPVSEHDIIFLSEYYKEDKLKWIDSDKQFATMLFVDADKRDEKLDILLSILDPDNCDEDGDKVSAMSTIIAEYPCTLATIVSYRSNDPNRIDSRPSYFIICRANSITIKDENYKYYHGDMK